MSNFLTNLPKAMMQGMNRENLERKVTYTIDAEFERDFITRISLQPQRLIMQISLFIKLICALMLANYHFDQFKDNFVEFVVMVIIVPVLWSSLMVVFAVIPIRIKALSERWFSFLLAFEVLLILFEWFMMWHSTRTITSEEKRSYVFMFLMGLDLVAMVGMAGATYLILYENPLPRPVLKSGRIVFEVSDSARQRGSDTYDTADSADNVANQIYVPKNENYNALSWDEFKFQYADVITFFEAHEKSPKAMPLSQIARKADVNPKFIERLYKCYQTKKITLDYDSEHP